MRSNQATLHPRLEPTVKRHLASRYLKPLAGHTEAAFASLQPVIEQHGGQLILDSGCGNGESSRWLARRHPDALIVGVDKSIHRLGGSVVAPIPRNCVLVRAELGDFWRLCTAAGWRFSRHYLLYPNPWPKSQHLGRRWHGSPVFPSLLALGGQLEIRSNWWIYVQEFAVAIRLAGGYARVSQWQPKQPITPFERKYDASGHTLWVCSAAAGP